MHREELEAMYADESFYWGTDHNELAARAVEHAPDRADLRAVDIGAGEGRDAVHLAANGMRVLAVDVARNGLAKAERLAADRGVELDTLLADVNSLSLAALVDLVYSIGTIQYLRPEHRESRFAHLRARTRPGGVHALFAFVDRDLPPAPDWGDNEFLYESGELDGYYDDWETCFAEAFVFDDDSGGHPHQHAAEERVYRRPREE